MVTRNGHSLNGPHATSIHHDIDRTRARMTRTVAEIEERLSPAHVKAQVLERLFDAKRTIKATAHDSAVGKAETMLSTIKENPIPAALIAIGVGWLLVNGRREKPGPSLAGAQRRATFGARTGAPPYLSGAYHRGARSMEARARDLVRDAEGRIEEITGGVRDRADAVVREARERGRAAERGARRRYDENPLLAGAVALAVGAAIGLALPHTRREDELVGKVRDRVLDAAGGLAQRAVDKAQEAATEVTEKVTGELGGATGPKGARRDGAAATSATGARTG